MRVRRILRDGPDFSSETSQTVLQEAARLADARYRLVQAFGSEQWQPWLEYPASVGRHKRWVFSQENRRRGLVSQQPAGVILTGRIHTAGTVKLWRTAAVSVAEIRDLITASIDMAFHTLVAGLKWVSF
jgi:LacI family gluconate utilization system Gnt-I transcriptional repressor